MHDPKPENVVGQKRVVHKVEHRIDWGYVAGGIGLLAVAWVGWRFFRDTGQDDDQEVMA